MKWFPKLIVALVCIALLVIAGIALLAVRLYLPIARGPADYAAELAALRRDGLPTDPSQLQRPIPSDAVNAAPDYEALGRLLKEHPIPPGINSTIDDVEKSTPAQQQTVRQFLQQHQDLVSLIHQAARKPGCVFKRNWSLGPDLLLPEYPTMREAAHIIHAESYLQALQGHYLQAVTTQALGLRVADHAGSDPTLIAYLVGVACEAIAICGEESILQMAGPDPTVCNAVQAAIQQNKPHLDLRNGLRGEIGLALVCGRRIRTGGMQTLSIMAGGDSQQSTSHPSGALRFLMNQFTDANVAAALSFDRKMAEACALPEAQRLAGSRAVSHEFAIALSNNGIPAPNILIPGIVRATCSKLGIPASLPNMILADIVIPVYDKTVEREYRAHAQERVIITAAAVLAYRGRHGAYPATLTQAMPHPLLDPFTQKPLIYRREKAGFVVYSVGQTGHYDGHPLSDKERGRETMFRYADAFCS